MKLMAFLGVALAFSLPVKAAWIYDTLDCPPYASGVEASAAMGLDFEDVYWYGLYVTYAVVEIDGPAGYAVGYGSGWDFSPAVANTSIGSPPGGTYSFFGWHYAFGWYGGYSYFISGASCEVQGSGGNDPTPSISSVNPNTWTAGQGYSVSIYGSGFGTSPELSITGTGVSAYMTYGSDTYISAQVSVSPNAPSGYADVQVISHGYNGMGFQQQPGGQGPASPFESVTVQAAPPPCAIPTDFHQESYNESNGTLSFVYKWASTSVNLSHLYGCRVGEFVSYPTANPFYFPQNPPFPAGLVFTNPTTGPSVEVDGALGMVTDVHDTPGTFVTPIPLGSTAFQAQQYYYYKCPCAGNASTQIYGTMAIGREVYTSIPSGLEGWFTVTKSGASSTKVVP